MNQKLIGRAGTSIKIVTGQIGKQLKLGTDKTRNGINIRKPNKVGTLTVKDWKTVSLGLSVLAKLVGEELRNNIMKYY